MMTVLLILSYIVRPLLLRRPKVVFFGAQAEEPRIFLFFRCHLVMVFGGQITFPTPPKKNSAPMCVRVRGLLSCVSVAVFASSPAGL